MLDKRALAKCGVFVRYGLAKRTRAKHILVNQVLACFAGLGLASALHGPDQENAQADVLVVRASCNLLDDLVERLKPQPTKSFEMGRCDG
eukprot:789874-Pleurochrysis_carterae.AAC.1